MVNQALKYWFEIILQSFEQFKHCVSISIESTLKTNAPQKGLRWRNVIKHKPSHRQHIYDWELILS